MNNTVNGSGSDTLDGLFIEYLAFAMYPENATQASDFAIKDAGEWIFVFTWFDAEGDVLGTSTCTITRPAQ